ncbi:unnamed protein product [Bursaphelenchus okinawaensis]|uniref:Uncharacterized protein n=1 Tax=Bursaphelenchus okinawaensis TaxID=465554 RepID=A0A811L6H1_9BILA|nr:unnamed protein product [Bursaphelenchus okinawaensis]CAG9117480.1 unnamed protein product [Bursaphelenchus okinawaensis]
MVVEYILQAVGVFGIVYVGYRILKLSWNLFYPYVFGCTRNLKKLAGANVAVITGATDGIGKAFAFELAAKGFDLVLVSRTQSKLDQTAADIGSAYDNIKVDTIAFDFSETNVDVYQEKLFNELDKYQIGVLVNNVGMAPEYPDILSELPYKEISNVLEISALPTTMLCANVLKQMNNRHKGVVINVSSAASKHTLAYWSVYSASKMYVNWLSAILRKEYSGSGITIQTLTPMMVATKMAKMDKTGLFVPSPAKYAKSALKTVGLANETSGYFFHQCQVEFGFKLAPGFVLDMLSGFESRKIKKRYLDNQRLLAQSQS